MLFLELISVFLFGGIAYGSLEMWWRGYTHWTMILVGGLCCVLVYLISTRMHEDLWHTVILGCAVITTVEFLVGCVLNLKLGWNIWDYSDQPLHLMGQICPLFSLAWLGLSLPGTLIARGLKRYVFVSPAKKHS